MKNDFARAHASCLTFGGNSICDATLIVVLDGQILPGIKIDKSEL